eukprot:scaffold1095_cov63-Phaeocystis_antarctica.AAC.5
MCYAPEGCQRGTHTNETLCGSIRGCTRRSNYRLKSPHTGRSGSLGAQRCMAAPNAVRLSVARPECAASCVCILLTTQSSRFP